MSYPRVFSVREIAVAEARSMRATGWPQARIRSTWADTDGPLFAEDEECWYITAGQGRVLLDDDHVDRPPPS